MPRGNYVPATITGELSLEALRSYIETELLAVSRFVSDNSVIELRPLYAEPERPRAGMLVYADGTTWDPGAGEGVYVYDLAGTWNKL